MSELTEGFEDRYGSPDFEQGKGANLGKFKERKEKTQMKKYGIKPTDTSIDVADLITRNVVGKALSEEMPKQELGVKSIDNQDDNEEEDNGEEEVDDTKKEMRVKIMQYLNPRIVKSHELKNYMSRSNIKEDIAARLNEIASAKLDLYKKAIAINATVDLSEARRMSAAEKLGRAFDLEQQRSALSRQRGIELLKTPESIRAAHDALHSKSATEEESEVDQLDEASRNPNVMRQGRTKVVKARVRGGKVQRRKRLSDVKGYTSHFDHYQLNGMDTNSDIHIHKNSVLTDKKQEPDHCQHHA